MQIEIKTNNKELLHSKLILLEEQLSKNPIIGDNFVMIKRLLMEKIEVEIIYKKQNRIIDAVLLKEFTKMIKRFDAKAEIKKVS